MHRKAQFRTFLVCTICFAAIMALVSVVPALAQNPVPPTARQAAASPAFSSKLHPSTPPAASRMRAAARARAGRASPQDEVIYENGPVNGTTDAWTINFGYIVSDTFVPNDSGVAGLDFYVWEFPGDALSSVQWSITSTPFGGTIYGSGTVSGSSLTDTFISTNQYGYDIDKVSASGLSVAVTSGSTYWVNLFNATVPSGNPVFWDENSGVGCQSTGCPSQAYESAYGTIPSEAFDITSGHPPGSYTAQADGWCTVPSCSPTTWMTGSRAGGAGLSLLSFHLRRVQICREVFTTATGTHTGTFSISTIIPGAGLR
jgi:hypothetical protein